MSNPRVTAEILSEFKELLASGETERNLRRWFRHATGLAKSQANSVYNSTVKSLNKLDNSPASLKLVSDKYYYNEDTDCYTINLTCQVKPLVLSGAKHRAIHRSYSEYGENLSEIEICRKYVLTAEIFSEYRRIFKLAKTSLPLSSEEILDHSESDNVNSIIENKKFRIFQDFEKESWRQTQKDAQQWREFQARILDPFSRFIENVKIPALDNYQAKQKSVNKYTWISVLNDLHFGNRASKSTLFRGQDQSTDVTIRNIEDYCNRTIDDITSLDLRPETLCIVSLGDLIHCNALGTTTKGTPVRFDILNEELFERAFDSLSNFVYKLSKLAPRIKIYSLRGNHLGTQDSLLFFCLSKLFINNKNIEFNIFKTYAGLFRERNTLFLASHGANDSMKIKAPINNRLETYIQSMLIHASETMDLTGVNSRAALFADLHNSMSKHFNDFDYFLFPTIQAGDEFGDALGYKADPKQISLLLDDNGIKASFNYSFK